MVKQKQKLNFRPATQEDLNFICEVELIPENSVFVGHDSLEKHRSCLSDPDCRYWIAEIQEVKQMTPNAAKHKVGFGILKGNTNPYKCMELYRIALNAHSRGYGSQFLHFLQNFTFQECRFHRLWLDVLTTNARAIHVYEKHGFIREGCLRECSKAQSGKFESLYIYAILSHEYIDMKF
ncbi:GNAT family N-acetyltransferase [Candidatus Lokiarchaeum ossiferum]|uniref:GNAT family N-acetyltransferase n=1 Tax=Candidatus Lokiarchaeum ossiferum TaxID=2951803 RepID=UPI00352E01DD